MKPRILVLFVGLATLPLALPALDWNAGRDFKANEYPNSPRELLNPNGTVTNWSYGYRATGTSTVLTLYTTNQHLNTMGGSTNVQGYYSGSGGSTCGVNVGPSNVVFNLGPGNLLPLKPGEIEQHPAQNGANVIVRWIAPSAAEYSVLAYWQDLDNHGGSGGIGWIVTNGVSRFSQPWTNGGGAGFTNTLTLAAGTIVDFALGPGADWWFDSTAFNALITNLSVVTLNIQPTGPGQATISWTPDTPGCVLQETLNLSPTNWLNSASGTMNPVTVPAATPLKFYRLYKP